MPLAKLRIPGGVIADRPEYSSGPVWRTADRVRFQQGLPEVIGGWQKNPNFAATGVPSNVHIWRDLSGNDLMAVGTEQFLYVLKNGTLYDITPIDSTASLNGAIDTTDTDNTVTVNDTSHPAKVGDWVVISGASAVGGLTINGTWQVATVPDANSWTFEHTSPATSTVSGGGGASIQVDYLLPTGYATSTPGLGWGADTWATSTWGTARDTSNISLEANIWSFDNWGEDLRACRRGGKIYGWDASVGVGTRAAAVTNAPTTNKFIMVSVPDRHLISFGAHTGSASDPLNIRWTEQETDTTWTATATNTAGDQRLHRGDYLVAAIQTREQILVWTDDALFSMVYRGPPFTFGFRHVATECAPVGQNVPVNQNGMVYWMGCGNFYVYAGVAKVLPCPVRDYVFDNLNEDTQDLVVGGLNRKFNEIWWHYPSSGSTYPDRYVTYNYVTQEWSIGTLGRTVWADTDSWLDNPVAYDSDGNFYYHEKGKSADGAALNWNIESGPFEIPEAGDKMFLVDRFITDVSSQTGDVTFTVYYRRYPNATEGSKSRTITSTTTKVTPRIRGRQMRFGYSSTELESFAKMGDLRADWKPDGDR